MVIQVHDQEKAFAAYTDDEHAPTKPIVDPPRPKPVPKQRPWWRSWKTILLFVIIIALTVARLVEGLVKVQWRKAAEYAERSLHEASADNALDQQAL